MERDFLSLGIKQEVSEETTDAASARNCPMQWPFLKKGGSSLLSFNGVQEEKQSIGLDYRALNISSTMKSTEVFHSAQKNIVSENQGGSRHSMVNYPTIHHDTYAFHHQVTNQTSQTISPASTISSYHTLIASSKQNQIGSPPLSAVPSTNPVPAVPSNSPVVGTTDWRNASSSMAQMTIFYNGSVCVYDNVAPEKAQAIMLLAGNGHSTTPSTPPPPLVQKSIARHNLVDGFVMGQCYSPSPNCSSPVPINSISVSGAVVRSISASNDSNVAKPSAVTISSLRNPEPVKVVNSPASLAAATNLSDAVPQFRRKSLARFLEKRKERMVSTNPYGEKADCSKPGGGYQIHGTDINLTKTCS